MVVVDEIGLAYCTMNIVQYRVAAAATVRSRQQSGHPLSKNSTALCIAQKQKPSIAVDFLRMSQNDFGTDDPGTKIDSYYSIFEKGGNTRKVVYLSLVKHFRVQADDVLF